MGFVHNHPAEEIAWLPLYSPKTPVEPAVVSSLLETEGIYYFEFNDLIGSLDVGPVIPSYNGSLSDLFRSHQP